MKGTEPFKGTAKENLRMLKIMGIAMITGMLIFSSLVFAFVYFQGPLLEEEPKPVNNVFSGVAILVACICFVMANNLLNKKLIEIKNTSTPLPDKLDLYRASLIIYLAICEGAGLFSIIIFLLSGNFYLLIIVGIVVFLMYSRLPSAQKLSDQLNLDYTERQQLD